MKPAIAYGIFGSAYATSWEIITITSEKAGRRGMVYGRDQHGNPTHANPAHVRGRFKKLEHAQTALEAITKLHEHHRPAIEAAQAELHRLERARTNALETALKNIKVDPVVIP